MIEPSNTDVWIFVGVTFIHGVLLLGLVYFLLRPTGKQYISTYNSEKKLFEDGPVLELPKGVSTPKSNS